MNWYPVPDAMLRRSTPTGVPSASVRSASLNAWATSVIQPSVVPSSPDFSVDDQISTGVGAGRRLDDDRELVDRGKRVGEVRAGRWRNRRAPGDGVVDPVDVVRQSVESRECFVLVERLAALAATARGGQHGQHDDG